MPRLRWGHVGHTTLPSAEVYPHQTPGMYSILRQQAVGCSPLGRNSCNKLWQLCHQHWRSSNTESLSERWAGQPACPPPQTMLKHLKRVFIQFHPTDARATAARELLARVGNDKSRKSNPECVVDYQVMETAQVPRSFVELQFTDNETQKLFTADLTVADIVRTIEQKATEMELRTVMKEVGYDPFNDANRQKQSLVRR